MVEKKNVKEVKKTKVPKVKADDFVRYDGSVLEEDQPNFTNFEFLKEKVDVLTSELVLVGKILKQNNMVYTEETLVETDEYLLDDIVYKRLEE